MTQTNCSDNPVCRCMENAVDPCCSMEVDNIVPAGDACESNCMGCDIPVATRLCTFPFPVQTYKSGYCPAEALMKGTLFPELVCPYTRGC